MPTTETTIEEKPFDVVGHIMAYETGEASDEETLRLFGHLVKTGQAWSLQGHYGRTASAIMRTGVIDKNGDIDWNKFEEMKGQ